MPDTKPPAPLPRVRGVSPLIWRRLLIPFEDLVVWLVTRSDKSTVAAFARVAWRTVGAMCERVAAEKLDPTRLAGLVDIGVDEISWRRHHKYLTLVSDHDTSKIVGAPEVTAGKDAAALDRFFDDLPEKAAERIEAVSMDLGPAYAKTVRARAPQAVLCFDPFRVIKLAGDTLDALRRQVWQSARRYPDKNHRQEVQGCPLGTAEKSPRPDRRTSQNRCRASQVRRRAVAGLRARLQLRIDAGGASFDGPVDHDPGAAVAVEHFGPQVRFPRPAPVFESLAHEIQGVGRPDRRRRHRASTVPDAVVASL